MEKFQMDQVFWQKVNKTEKGHFVNSQPQILVHL